MKFLHAAAFAVILTVAGVPFFPLKSPPPDKDKPKQQRGEKETAGSKGKPQTSDERPKSERNPIQKKAKARKQTNRSTSRKNRRKRTKQQQKAIPRRNQAERHIPARLPDERLAAFRTNIPCQLGRHAPFSRAAKRDRVSYSGYSLN